MQLRRSKRLGIRNEIESSATINVLTCTRTEKGSNPKKIRLTDDDCSYMGENHYYSISRCKDEDIGSIDDNFDKLLPSQNRPSADERNSAEVQSLRHPNWVLLPDPSQILSMK